ncbi:rare lipoprotein A [Chitinophaga skermanii]|uniref:Probable endolytic peptidoglycan transglycosylase RlpA n=1 Tax=Chitinophaga skermanii TaxID=331697 RepID=A0A327QA36_9BACT|nr:septal ring lytic transglycosylase RlpA family protein [Chitinophaga skermanii]RAI98676.1 rare lipoprotein A [Chitinophaga skermanii]
MKGRLLIAKGVLFATIAFSIASCSPKITESGKASYYADKFEGRKTASGARFSQNKNTAAHKTLPFGTRVKVVNLTNGKTVTVTINDRGPFAPGRIIDLSKKAAKKIDLTQAGVANVKIKYKKPRKG